MLGDENRLQGRLDLYEDRLTKKKLEIVFVPWIHFHETHSKDKSTWNISAKSTK